MIAARRLHLPLRSAQRPSPRSASDVSLVVLTVKIAASAPAAPSSSAQAHGSIVRLGIFMESVGWTIGRCRVIQGASVAAIVLHDLKSATGRKRPAPNQPLPR